jgi:F1F0 ATPase subunit 2
MILAIIAGFAAGAILGAAHLASLWWSVVLIRDDRPVLAVAAQALRFVVLAAALALIAHHGAAPFLAAAAGVAAARVLLLRRLEKLA